MIDKSNNAITIVSSETGFILDANEKASNSLGYSRDELLNMHIYDFDVNLPDNFSWKDHVKKIHKEGGLHFEGNHRRKDGSIFRVEISAKLHEYGNKSRLITIARDINEINQSKTEMERLIKAFSSSSEGIALTDEKGRFIYVNEAHSKIYGYTQKELIGNTWRKITPAKKNSPTGKGVTNTIHNKDIGLFYGEVPGLRKDGKIVPTEVTGKDIWDENGIYRGHICIIRDITGKRAIEELHLENERLISSNKTKSKLLTIMSHELRTPLTSIIGYSRILEGEIEGQLNDKQKFFLDNIIKSSKHLVDLINNFLQLAEIEAGKREMVFEDISVADAINEVLELIKENASERGIILRREFDLKMPPIQADRVALKQILLNLLSNAMKFRKKEGGNITVSTRRINEMVKISIADTGIGLKEEDIPRLFQKFEQIDSDLSRKYDGTGIGLAITKELIDILGGQIWVSSELGVGSTFNFLLPIKANKGKKFK